MSWAAQNGIVDPNAVRLVKVSHKATDSTPADMPRQTRITNSSSSNHQPTTAVANTMQSPQPYPRQGYIPLSQLLNAEVGNDYSGHHYGGVPVSEMYHNR